MSASPALHLPDLHNVTQISKPGDPKLWSALSSSATKVRVYEVAASASRQRAQQFTEQVPRVARRLANMPAPPGLLPTTFTAHVESETQGLYVATESLPTVDFQSGCGPQTIVSLRLLCELLDNEKGRLDALPIVRPWHFGLRNDGRVTLLQWPVGPRQSTTDVGMDEQDCARALAATAAHWLSGAPYVPPSEPGTTGTAPDLPGSLPPDASRALTEILTGRAHHPTLLGLAGTLLTISSAAGVEGHLARLGPTEPAGYDLSTTALGGPGLSSYEEASWASPAAVFSGPAPPTRRPNRARKVGVAGVILVLLSVGAGAFALFRDRGRSDASEASNPLEAGNNGAEDAIAAEVPSTEGAQEAPQPSIVSSSSPGPDAGGIGAPPEITELRRPDASTIEVEWTSDFEGVTGFQVQIAYGSVLGEETQRIEPVDSEGQSLPVTARSFSLPIPADSADACVAVIALGPDNQTSTPRCISEG